MRKLSPVLCLLLGSFTLEAQNIINAFNAGKGNANFSVSYTYETFDELIVNGEPVDISQSLGEIDVHSVSVYGEYGITDRLDVIATVPYIKSVATNPTRKISDEGFQDLSIFAKYALFQTEGTLNSIDVVSALGVGIPTSDYDPTGSINIGNHAFSTRMALAGLSRWHYGLFTEVSLGYDIRSENVPNNLNGHLKVGWSSNKIYTHIWYQFSECFDGTNLGTPGIELQRLDVDTQRVGVLISYNIIPRLSVFAGTGTFLEGENTGNTDFFINTGISTSLHFLR